MTTPLPTPAVQPSELIPNAGGVLGALYTAEQLQAYGQACRDAALEEAAQAAIDACGFNGATVQLEAHIRTAIKELK